VEETAQRPNAAPKKPTAKTRTSGGQPRVGGGQRKRNAMPASKKRTVTSVGNNRYLVATKNIKPPVGEGKRGEK